MADFAEGTLPSSDGPGDVAMHSFRADGVITGWSAAAERLYGWAAADANGADVSMIVPPERRAELAGFRERLQRGEIIHADTVCLHKGGSRVAVTATFAGVVGADGELAAVAVTSRAADPRRLAATQLEENIFLHEQAQALAHVGTWMSSAVLGEGTVWSRELYRILGVDESVPPSVETFLSLVHPDDVHLIHRTRVDAIELGLPYDLELRIRRPDGELRWLHASGTVVRDAAGNPLRVIGVTQDITERRRAEAALRQSQKMEAIGRLAGGVAHDFNNLLCLILTYSALVLDALPTGDPLRDDVAEIRAAGERASELTKQLLAFSRRQVLAPTELEIEHVFGSADKMLRRLLGEDIALSFTVEGAPRVHVDRGQLDQVLMNLSVNARDAMPDGGTLEISASVVEIDALEAARREVSPGAYVLISVADDGCGMTHEVSSRVFEPFFTTKEAGRGTGLGMATVFGVVEQSGGAIAVSSEVGRGTRFEILLPHTRASATAAPPPIPIAPGARGTETVLLVEDEERVRTLVRGLLRSHGYEVVDASNAGEALLVCEQHPAPIDLLVTDVVLPRMNGRELAERIAPNRPEMRVLYVSGYTDDEVFHRGVRAERMAFLHKPFTPAVLLRKVRAVLDGEAANAIAC